MTWFSFIVSGVMTVFVAALMIAMPAVSRPTLPLGVSVPQAHVNEPVIRGAVRRYRISVFAVFVFALAAGAVLAVFAPVVALVAPILLLTVLSVGAYVVSRGRIIRAKHEGDWYENVPVRLTAEVTGHDTTAGTVPFGWFLAAAIVLLAAAGVGAALYPGLPRSIPTHWDAAGEVDAHAAKSIWTVFGPLMIGLGMTVLLFAIALLARVSPLRPVASDSGQENARRVAVQRRLLGSLLGQIAVIVGLMLACLSLVGWLAPASGAILVALLGFVVLIAVAIVVFFVRYRRAVAAHVPDADSARSDADSARPDAPDDDRYWRGGFVYFNRNDPAIFVPKRFGIGWTMNLGSVGGMLVGVALIAVIVVAIVLPLVQR